MQTTAGISHWNNKPQPYLHVEVPYMPYDLSYLRVYVKNHAVDRVSYNGLISVDMALRLEQRAYRVGLHNFSFVKHVLPRLPINMHVRLTQQYAAHGLRELQRKVEAKKRAALAKKAQYSTQDPYYGLGVTKSLPALGDYVTPGFRVDQYGLY